MGTKNFRLYLDVAIDVVQTRDLQALQFLKNFLTALPSPKEMETVLGLVVLHFAAHDRAVFEWIIQSQVAFAPELDLLNFTKSRVIARFSDRGWVQGRDFRFEFENTLWVSRTLRHNWTECYSKGELLLLKTLLRISD